MAIVPASTKSVAEKLLIKPGRSVLFVNTIPGYDKILGRLPEGVIVATSSTKSVDIIQLFIVSRKGLEQELPKLKKMVTPKGMIWLTYPKLTSTKKADINRDSIAAYAESLGMEGESMVSIDEDWSALRLKIVE